MADTLRYLVDRFEISDLLARYSTALDSRDWELLREVFVPDASCDYGSLGHPRSVEEIIALVRGTLDGLDATEHLIGNVVAAVDGDEATAEAYVIAQHMRRGARGGDDYLIGARYSDRLARTPDGWRIKHRTIHRMWWTGNRDVIQRPDGAR
jgi:3-phenylpropionate/cinnamic acid dioxygenase small subunit